MIYRLDKCSVCGSDQLEQIDKKIVGLDTCLVYKCKCCDERLSARIPKKVESKPMKVEQPAKKELTAIDIFENNKESVINLFSKVKDNTFSAGTGFIISKDGYLITNAHVVTNLAKATNTQLKFNINEDIKANFKDKKTAECEIISVDIENDLAILKLDSDIPTKPLKLGSYSSVKTGQTVLAIGNSKGEGLSITEGIVSDRERKYDNTSNIMVSVPVNQGNSGGPLFNLNNEVIGVITFGKKDAVAMNYAINIDDVKDFIKKTEQKEDIKII